MSEITAKDATSKLAAPALAAAHGHGLPPVKVGVACFLVSDTIMFLTFIVAYLFYLGKDVLGGPQPKQVLGLLLPVLGTIFLLSSSATFYLAERALQRGSRSGFHLCLAVTAVLGVLFLVATGIEWSELIGKHGLTLGRNHFGTTYFALLGFHGLHVTVGVLVMLTILGLSVASQVSAGHAVGVEMVGWYWHLVDAVWLVIFSIVYLFGR